MDPTTNPEAYRFSYADTPWIGEVVCSGHDRNWTWDVQKAKGQKGASSSLQGDDVAEFDVTFLIVNDPATKIDQFAAFDEYRKLLESSVASSKPKALPIYYPDLAEQHITSASIKSIGGKVYDGKGGAAVKVKFIEFRPPKKKASSTATSSKNGGKNAKNDPNLVRKVEVEALHQQANGPNPVATTSL